MSHFFLSAGSAIPEIIDNGGYRRDKFTCVLAAVSTLSAAGIAAPDEWPALLQRYERYVDLGDQSTDRLIKAIVTGNGGDLVELRNHAVAEEQAGPGADAHVNERVRDAVLGELLRLYEPVSRANYRQAAEIYSQAGKRFHGVARTVDVEASGDTLIMATAAQREAWLSAPGLAAELDAAQHVLYAAAALAGAPGDVAFTTAATDAATQEHQIALAADPGKAHRRKVWLAWSHTGGRTRRWGALVSLGVKLTAGKDPAVTPYAKPPQPIPVTDPDHRLRYWDPLDGAPPRGYRTAGVGWEGEDRAALFETAP